MTKEQVLGLLKYINSYYRNRFELPNNKDELKAIVVTWHDFLSEIDYSKAQVAVKKLMVEKEWPPTPGDCQRSEETASPERGQAYSRGSLGDGSESY